MIAGMIMDETGGKADAALVQHWTHLPSPGMTVRFAYPGDPPKGVTVFECAGHRRSLSDYSTCTPVPGHDALSMGIITSVKILHLNP